MSECPSTLQRLVDRCGQLYSLPVVAMRVLELTESPAVDVRALKECIENDPALTSKVLRVVNSSLFGLSREVTDLNQAIALLGINPLKLLVLGFSLPSDLFVGLNGDILRRYWHRTLIKAVAAREISQTILRMPGDEAFIAGLLQDIGALVLLQELGEGYARYLDSALAKASNVADAEQAALGFNHATLSARLLERWKLPQQLVIAVEAGQSRERIAALPPIDRPMAQVLLLAELVGSLFAENRTDLLVELLDRGREYLALTHTQLAALVTALGERVNHLAEVLDLELPAGLDYQAILVQAHERLADVASSAAGQILDDKADRNALQPDRALLAELRRLSSEVAAGGATSSRPPVRRESAAATGSVAVALAGLATDPGGSSIEASTSPRGGSAVAAGAAAARYEVPALGQFAQRALPLRPSRDSSKSAETGYDPGFSGRVAAAVATCRQARCSLSLLIVAFDQFADLLITCGPAAGDQLMDLLGDQCRTVDHQGAVVVQPRDLQFAVILPDCDRRQSVDASNDLVARVRQAAGKTHRAEIAALMTVSVGVASVALPPKNFPAIELIRAAERCITGAHLSGGNAVKSIEIY